MINVNFQLYLVVFTVFWSSFAAISVRIYILLIHTSIAITKLSEKLHISHHCTTGLPQKISCSS